MTAYVSLPTEGQHVTSIKEQHTMVNTMLVPLSPLDHNGVPGVGATLGYVLKSVDAAAIEATAKRVINKWRLLAGRPEWDRRRATWCIRVPLDGDVSDRLKFSMSKLAVALDTPIVHVDDTTGDIIIAWLLKAVYLKGRGTTPVSMMSVFSVRSLLRHMNPAFATYTYNAIMPCATPVLSKEEIQTKSLTELAVMHHQNVDAARNTSFIGQYGYWLAKIGGGTIPLRRPAGNFWMVTNQSIGHWDEIDFGSEMIAQWFCSFPIMADQTITLNRFKGGYVVEVGMRPSGWKQQW